MKHTAVLILGDGLGPERSAGAVQVVAASGAHVEWTTVQVEACLDRSVASHSAAWHHATGHQEASKCVEGPQVRRPSVVVLRRSTLRFANKAISLGQYGQFEPGLRGGAICEKLT